ncbi:hypothetical protein PVK06_031606 [Gossypium arboreum]|uniref:RNase H type-1 domain-containing protein n=1 Tax=Gossypium arboreum TaxID=29729 RepID=A0ABR0NRG2_GOSAR|nr:hypothetical protein PVK06_031606 [Gossypium arboreum]
MGWTKLNADVAFQFQTPRGLQRDRTGDGQVIVETDNKGVVQMLSANAHESNNQALARRIMVRNEEDEQGLVAVSLTARPGTLTSETIDKCLNATSLASWEGLTTLAAASSSVTRTITRDSSMAHFLSMDFMHHHTNCTKIT